MSSCFKNYPAVNEDANAKSKSFNFKTDLSFLDRTMLKQLVEFGQKEKQNARISLHTSPENALHNMIIMQLKGTYNRPHKHVLKAEAYHLIHGEQKVIIFDNEGGIRESCRMSARGRFIYRFEKNLFHMSIPLSDIVVFHESKTGPFIRQGDSVYPNWAPETDEPDKINRFMKSLEAS
ncbi:MAG: WbuC family cupin fold metalloprotein [Desulfobacula sp.]|jgi:glucose-6-phosphate isomerase